MKKLLLLLAGTTLLAGCDEHAISKKADDRKTTAAAKVKEEYQFQERCGKSAADWFAREWGNGTVTSSDGSQIHADFSDHYNAKRNKCFVMLGSTSFSKSGMMISQVLFDVHEHKEYGDLITEGPEERLVLCTFLDAPCASAAVWKALAKPYMEE